MHRLPCSKYAEPAESDARAWMRQDYLFIHMAAYGEPDGSCIRGCIHAAGLADAHLPAVRYLEHGGESGVLKAAARIRLIRRAAWQYQEDIGR